nr:hypothetical protein [Tanacetum cinerariifolium]
MAQVLPTRIGVTQLVQGRAAGQRLPFRGSNRDADAVEDGKLVGVAARLPDAARELLPEGLSIRQRGWVSVQGIGLGGGKLVAVLPPAGGKDGRHALGRGRQNEGPAGGDVLALVINGLQLSSIGKHPRGHVQLERARRPAAPELHHGFVHLPGAGVFVVVVEGARKVVEQGERGPGRDHVPAHAALADEVHRAHSAGNGERLVNGSRHGRYQADPLGGFGHQGHQYHRVQGAHRRLRANVIGEAWHIHQEETVHLGLLGQLRALDEDVFVDETRFVFRRPAPAARLQALPTGELRDKFIFCMRPLYHPPVEEITVQGIMHALADPVRVRILMELISSDSTNNCTSFTNIYLTPLPKSTLSKHFAVLREAGLISSERKGVELRNQMRSNDLVPKFGRLLDAILEAYKQEIEATTHVPAYQPVADSLEGTFTGGQLSHDELDAITAALVGHFYLDGQFEALGDARESCLIIPKLPTQPGAAGALCAMSRGS